MPKAILDVCHDPYATRRRADRGLDVPCYRCLAYEPGTERGCRFVNQRQKVIRKPAKEEVSPLRVARQAPGQLELMVPTGDVLSKESEDG